MEKLDDFKFSFEDVSMDSTSISSQDEVPQPESSGPEEFVELSPQQFPGEQFPELCPEGIGEVPLKFVNSDFKPKFTNSVFTFGLGKAE